LKATRFAFRPSFIPTPTGVGRRRWAIALAGLVLVTGGLWGFGVRLSGSPVPEAAAHLAVLPFRASGSGEVREFGVGVVDLLSTALSDVGGIRTVPSRTVFATLGRSGEPGTLTLEEDLALGRAFARAHQMVLLGSYQAFDSLEAYVRRNPDDPMGWYHLGDARFHAGFLGRFSDEEIIGPFLESARVDPALGLGLHHVVDMALESGDRELFHQAFERYASFAAEAPVERLRR
jgi:hypothetical protein